MSKRNEQELSARILSPFFQIQTLLNDQLCYKSFLQQFVQQEMQWISVKLLSLFAISFCNLACNGIFLLFDVFRLKKSLELSFTLANSLKSVSVQKQALDTWQQMDFYKCVGCKMQHFFTSLCQNLMSQLRVGQKVLQIGIEVHISNAAFCGQCQTY